MTHLRLVIYPERRWLRTELVCAAVDHELEARGRNAAEALANLKGALRLLARGESFLYGRLGEEREELEARFLQGLALAARPMLDGPGDRDFVVDDLRVA